MKTTRKIGVVTALLVSLAFASQAQTAPASSSSTSDKEWRLSVGPSFDIPIGPSANSISWEFGGFVQVDIPIFTKFYVIADAGYKDAFVKDNKTIGRNIQQIPVMAGVKYFLLGNLLYVQGQAGANFIGNKSDLGANKSASFTYSPQVGVLLPIAHKNYLDLGVNFQQTSSFYNGGPDFNTFGVRLAYSFGL